MLLPEQQENGLGGPVGIKALLRIWPDFEALRCKCEYEKALALKNLQFNVKQQRKRQPTGEETKD